MAKFSHDLFCVRNRCPLKGCKRFIAVDALGLILQVGVTVVNTTEREGGKQVLRRVKWMGKAVSRLSLIWFDGGLSGAPFMMWVMDVCHWVV
ncbi:MAG: transposase [Microcoleaceae cyanobacterium]